MEDKYKDTESYMKELGKVLDRMDRGGFMLDSGGLPSDTFARPDRRGPKKRPVDLDSINIKVVGNGYIVTSAETGDRLFVFDDMEKLKEFIENSLAATEEQQDFIDEV